MGFHLYRDLHWLPRPPANFNELCKKLAQPSQELDDDQASLLCQNLASFAMDADQLPRLAKAIRAARANGFSLSKLTPYRLGIVSNGTTDYMVPALVASATRHGIALECHAAGFDQALQESVSADSSLHRFSPDAVLIALDFRSVVRKSQRGSKEAASDAVSAAVEQIGAIRKGIRSHSRALCILQNIAPPPENLFGSFERALPGAPRNLVDSINRELAESIAGSGDVLFDVAGLAETVGLAEWHDPNQWNLAKLSFSQNFLPLYADHVGRILGALRGKSRRCLILDLDNTLWGGVIGDDGVAGILVSQGDPAGEAFLNFQQYALSLRERGIVLAVSSKNQDETARLPFRDHPDMVLREDHFAVFQANWKDKASNIQAIADELSLGLESMVFVDDNPSERAIVRTSLPQVAVPEMPSDPALFARTLSAGGYFESVTFSPEDLERANFYQGNARRAALQKQVGDVEAHLRSLDMEITFQPFDKVGRARIAQLVAKSNQFNLTTKRYSEAEIAAIEGDPECFTMQVRLSDTFGDNGMISVIICRPRAPKGWEFDTWLMSCRVLGRGVEKMVLREVLEHAKNRNIVTLTGVYRPTDRNKLVENHYATLGFSLVKQLEDQTSVWELDIASANIEAAPMRVRSTGYSKPSIAAVLP